MHEKKLSLLLAVVITLSLSVTTVSAIEWVHIYRDDTAKISESDPGPFDEYLDLDSLRVVEGWALYTTKRILDDAPNEYHGKVELATAALSCKQFKIGYLYTGIFADVEQRTPIFEQTKSIVEMEKTAFDFVRGGLPISNTPAQLYYHFACNGLDLHKRDITGVAN